MKGIKPDFRIPQALKPALPVNYMCDLLFTYFDCARILVVCMGFLQFWPEGAI